MALNSGCPGAKLFKEITPDYIACPHCHTEIEIWSDEPVIQCPSCHKEVTQARGASCIDWCQFAKECVGAEKFERLRLPE